MGIILGRRRVSGGEWGIVLGGGGWESNFGEWGGRGGESFNDAPILIIKEKMTKTEVSLIDYSTPLKQ